MPALRFIGVAVLFTALFTVRAAHAAVVDNAALSTETDGRDWAAYGRTFSENHYSPLTEINRESVARLKLAWSLDLDVASVQSTPLAVAGVIYVAAGYSVVHAIDAKTGKLLWRYDPETLKVAGAKLRAGWGIRGLAFWKDRLLVGTHDGRLIALDAKNGTVVWNTQTLEANDGSFISGAPRAFSDKVVIGFGATGGAHGQVTAYDSGTGKQLWRWHAPGGGGAVWNAMSYDPELNRLYVGTGNARGADGATNKFACAVVALNADSGEYVWHFDTAPGDHTGCDASLDITLVTLVIDGQPRKVILHAPKDGSMYVLDRETGKALSAKKLGEGAHDHFAQAFSPKSGLVYVPTTELQASAAADTVDVAKSSLIAWDPVKQRPLWAVPTPGAFSGGALVTGGDLVFQGQADGYLNAYSATEGRKVWSFYAALSSLGAPITFAIGKTQYLAILTGPLSGSAASLGAASAKFGWDSRLHPRRLLVFMLDGKAKLPPTPGPTFEKPLDAPEFAVDEALAKEGATRFASCQSCHGAGAIAGGAAPDLRAAQSALNAAPFATIVKGGLETRGMPKFGELSDRDLDSLRHFIRSRARLATRPNGVAPPAPEAPATPPADNKPADEEPPKPPGSLESQSPPRT
jgi:quinohemoprotein ethanol dehydrogenase